MRSTTAEICARMVGITTAVVGLSAAEGAIAGAVGWRALHAAEGWKNVGFSCMQFVGANALGSSLFALIPIASKFKKIIKGSRRIAPSGGRVLLWMSCKGIFGGILGAGLLGLIKNDEQLVFSGMAAFTGGSILAAGAGALLCCCVCAKKATYLFQKRIG